MTAEEKKAEITPTPTPASAPAPAPAAAAAKPPVEEKQTNCLACNKPIKRLKRYYRDGKFYCSKKCWRKFVTDKKKESAK